MKILKRSFYERATTEVARDLLGKIVVRTWNKHVFSGIIIETEAYCGPFDAACHAYKGETPRNSALFGPSGHTYIYFVYGMHYCLNIVAKEKSTVSGGVLIRGLIPVTGISEMKKARHTDDLSNLLNGPGKIGQALHLTIAENSIDVTKKDGLYILEGCAVEPKNIIATPRIGISKAPEQLWRFILDKESCKEIKKQAY